MTFLKFLPLAAVACIAGMTTGAQAEALNGFVTAASKSCTASPCTLSVTVPENPFFLLEGVYCQLGINAGIAGLSLPVPAAGAGTGTPVIVIPLAPVVGIATAGFVANLTLPPVIEFTGASPIEVIAVGMFSAKNPATLSCTITGSGPGPV